MLRQISLIVAALLSAAAVAQGRQASEGPESVLSVILGRPTDHSAAVNVCSAQDAQVFVEFGPESGQYNGRTPARSLKAGEPVEFELGGLLPDHAYVYRLNFQKIGDGGYEKREECRFHTQRRPGDSFTFAVQGDSHPERPGRMYDADLYVRTLRNVAADKPDFYFMMGDDFSIERLFEQKSLSPASVDAVYSHQRGFVGIVGKSTPLMLVNGNHEQAAKYLLDGTANNGAVYAGRARTKFYPLPSPDGFYSGNAEPVDHIGLLRDYYAWQWGDALFVVIDPYWHSSVVVDNEAGAKAPRRPGEKAAQPGEQNEARKGKGNRDLWQVTLGDTQYHWLETTLQESHAKFKFVFCHHVLGTGRGGVEEATRYEWGGQDGGGGKRDRNQGDGDSQPVRRGLDRFFQNRPTWDKPIHALLRDTGVTIFFQGHDHLYAHQELDGVVYQTCPNPADPTFTAFNKEAYRSGDIFPNSGHLRVIVSGGANASCTVQYVRSLRPGDQTGGLKNGSIVHEYTVKPRAFVSPSPLRKEADR